MSFPHWQKTRLSLSRLALALGLAAVLALAAAPAPAYQWAPADVNRALDAHNQGDLAEALRLYTLAIDSGELDPQGLALTYNDRAAAWADQGDATRKKKGYDQALADYAKAIEINPAWGLLYTNRGLTWQRLGQYQKALDDFDRSMEVEAGYGPAYQAKAWLLATCPDPKFIKGPEALEMALRAVYIDRNQSTLDTLAAAQARVGDFPQAVKLQEMAIDLVKGPRGEEPVPEDMQRRLTLYRQKKPYVAPRPLAADFK